MPSHQQPSWASGGEVAGPPMQQTPTDYTRVVQHALVLGPGDHVKSNPTVSAPSAGPLAQLFNQTLHRNLVNLSLHAWALEPQLPRKQGLRLKRINRSIYEAKWTMRFTKWYLSNQVDFSTPSHEKKNPQDLCEALDLLDCLPVGLGFRQVKSEIHAWLHNNFSHQSDWSMVSLYPSASELEPLYLGPVVATQQIHK